MTSPAVGCRGCVRARALAPATTSRAVVSLIFVSRLGVVRVTTYLVAALQQCVQKLETALVTALRVVGVRHTASRLIQGARVLGVAFTLIIPSPAAATGYPEIEPENEIEMV